MDPDIPLAAVAIDLVILTVTGDYLMALAIRRGIPPFEGRWALPGGFVLAEEDLTQAARRELGEETGLADLPVHLEQLGTYGAPGRDPRGRVVAIAYLALAPDLPLPTAGSDAAAARWCAVGSILGELAFDHTQILADGVERARAKLEYTPLAAAFCSDPFTIAELRHVYEVVWGVELDPRNFHRKVTSTAGFLVPAEGTTTRDGGRPAQLYLVGPADVLRPPLMRPVGTALDGSDRR
jgi:8-oxo-dGTP diphosphatase